MRANDVSVDWKGCYTVIGRPGVGLLDRRRRRFEAMCRRGRALLEVWLFIALFSKRLALGARASAAP
jgi:hypothetical protein